MRDNKTTADILAKAAELYKQRNEQYGDTFLIVGEVLEKLFPDGIILKTKEDHTRMHLFEWMIGKIVRYASNFQKGGYQDSIHDAVVYCAMLESVDSSIKTEEK